MPMALMIRTNYFASLPGGRHIDLTPTSMGRLLLRCRPTTCLLSLLVVVQCCRCLQLGSAAPWIAHTASDSEAFWLLAPERGRQPALRHACRAQQQQQLPASWLPRLFAVRRPPLLAPPAQRCHRPPGHSQRTWPLACRRRTTTTHSLQPWHRSLRLPTSVGGPWEGCAATCRSAASAAKVRLLCGAQMMAAVKAPACLHVRSPTTCLCPLQVWWSAASCWR